MSKTITWNDGTTETINVSSKGQVSLNGINIKPFGFCFFGWLGMTESAIDKMLDWMDSKGVRFVDIYFNTVSGGLPEKVAGFFPKFYDHKKFVRLICAPNETETFTEYVEWQTRFNAVIDRICINSKWANMVYAVEVTHEAGLKAFGLGLTIEQLSDTLDAYYGHASAKLSSSNIGLVPICHADSVWANPSQPERRSYWIKVMEKTDVIWFDSYPTTLVNMVNNLVEYRNLAAQAGKNPAQGHKFWYEFGQHRDGTNPQYIPVDYLKYLLKQPETGDIFLFYVYEGYDPSPQYPTWYFDLEGNAESWTEAIAPYFPVYTIPEPTNGAALILALAAILLSMVLIASVGGRK